MNICLTPKTLAQTQSLIDSACAGWRALVEANPEIKLAETQFSKAIDEPAMEGWAMIHLGSKLAGL